MPLCERIRSAFGTATGWPAGSSAVKYCFLASKNLSEIASTDWFATCTADDRMVYHFPPGHSVGRRLPPHS